MKNIPGRQEYPAEQTKYVKLQNPSAVLIYFIGGITYGEISAIRMIAKMTGRKAEGCVDKWVGISNNHHHPTISFSPPR